MRRRSIIVLAVLSLLTCVVAAYSFAARTAGTVASYTGCLKNGKMESLAAGDTPLAPCGAGQSQVRLSGGDVTAVTAATGLTGGGDGGDVSLGVDPTAIQSRVGENCLRLDASISAIGQDGSVTCNPDDTGAGAEVVAGFYDGPRPVPLAAGSPFPFAPVPIARLPLPAGKYAISATLDLEDTAGDLGDSVSCELHAGADYDASRVQLATFNTPESKARMALQVVHQFEAPGAAEVRCGHVLDVTEWSFLKVVAVRVGSLANGPLTLVSP